MEVISDSESAADAELKVAEYLAGGTPEVWQVYGKQRLVRVRTGGIRDFTAQEVLTTSVLPGFQVPGQSFFMRQLFTYRQIFRSRPKSVAAKEIAAPAKYNQIGG